MKPLAFPLLTDENLHPDVITALRDRGHDVVSVTDLDAAGCSDRHLLGVAHGGGRVVLTHDRDFGTLAVREGVAFTGIIYLRPGHIDAGVVLEVLAAIAGIDVDVEPPFIVVAELRGRQVHIRFRPGLPPHR